jgi:hypothetical protein
MQYGSLQNMMIANDTPPRVPVVGDAATVIYYTDREPATVIAVSANARTVQIQIDRARRIDAHGMSDCQSYEYERDPGGLKLTFTLRKSGKYVVMRQGQGGTRLILGRRDKYYDFSF